MAVPTPWTAAALAVLADGGWHPREQVLAAGARAVPPGVAFRCGEKERRRLARRDGYSFGPRVRGNDATSIHTGAHRRVEQNLRSLIGRGRLERALIDGVDSIRITPAHTKAS